ASFPPRNGPDPLRRRSTGPCAALPSRTLPRRVDARPLFGKRRGATRTHDATVCITCHTSQRGLAVTADQQLRTARAGRFRSDATSNPASLAGPDRFELRQLTRQARATAARLEPGCVII